ncbi:MAG: hypothetical protein COB49_11060, partial [Alphaproteobacteria bacterium]
INIIFNFFKIILSKNIESERQLRKNKRWYLPLRSKDKYPQRTVIWQGQKIPQEYYLGYEQADRSNASH